MINISFEDFPQALILCQIILRTVAGERTGTMGVSLASTVLNVTFGLTASARGQDQDKGARENAPELSGWSGGDEKKGEAVYSGLRWVCLNGSLCLNFGTNFVHMLLAFSSLSMGYSTGS
jgi:hypothetical protein